MRGSLLSFALFASVLLAFPAVAQVKNVDWTIFEVESAEGRDASYRGAVLKAQQDAIDTTVRSLFAQSQEEWARYQEHRGEVLEGLAGYLKDFRISNKYRQGGDVVLEAAAVVLREPLHARLKQLGLVQDLVDSVPLSEQPRVLALVNRAGLDRDLSFFALGRINDYLSKKQLEVIEQSAIGDLLEEDASIAPEIAAGSANLALQSQADLYLMLDAEVRHTRDFGQTSLYRAFVRIEARAPFSQEPIEVKEYQSQELAFATVGDQTKSKQAAIEEAVGGAIEPLSQTVFKVWKEGKSMGHLYRIRYRGQPGSVRDRLVAAVRPLVSLIRSEQTVDGLSLTFRYPGKLVDLLEQLVDTVGNNLQVESEATSEVILRGS